MINITARTKRLMTGIVLVWSVLPFLWIVANRPFNDIFVARTVADVKLSLNSGGHLQFLWGAENHPSLEALVLVLSQFFSIDPQVLQFVPIGGVLGKSRSTLTFS